jgi:hypothetical protein
LFNLHQISNFSTDFHEVPNIQFHVNTFIGSRTDTDRRTPSHDELVDHFCEYAKVPPPKKKQKGGGKLRLATARLFMKCEIVWDMMPCQLVHSESLLPPSSGLQKLALRMQAENSFEISVTVHQSTRRHIADALQLTASNRCQAQNPNVSPNSTEAKIYLTR